MVTVQSGRGLVSALADTDVDEAVLLVDVKLTNSDWEGFPSPIPLLRNFTIRGDDGSASSGPVRPSLDSTSQIGRMRLGHMVTLTLQRIALISVMSGNINLAPHIELLAEGLPGDQSTLYIEDSIGVLKICYPPDVQAQVLALTPRAPWLPGNQSHQGTVPQPGCVNASRDSAASLPPDLRCWPQRGTFFDVAVLAFSVDALQKQVYQGYGIHCRNTSYACTDVLTYECVEEFGAVGCMTAWLAGVLSPPPPLQEALPPPPLDRGGVGQGNSTSSSGESGGSGLRERDGDGWRLGAVLGGVLGGVALMGGVAAALTTTAARRRRTRECTGCGEVGADKSGPASTVSGAGVSNTPSGAPPISKKATSNDDKFGQYRGLSTASREGTDALTANGTGEWSSAPESASVTVVMAPPREMENLEALRPGDTAHLGTQRDEEAVAAAAAVMVPSGTPKPPHRDPFADRRRPRPDTWMAVTPLTPLRPDVRLGPDLACEVKLLTTVLGAGAYGRVVEGVYQGQPVAIKLILDSTLDVWGFKGHALQADSLKAAAYESGAGPAGAGAGGDAAAGDPAGAMGNTRGQLARALAQEVEVLARCRHRNVVTLLAACLTSPRFCLVMERCDTSLDRLLYGRPGELLPMWQVLAIALDIARGLEYLHPTVVHRDLKPGNVLVNRVGSPQQVAKLSDFGLSRLRSTEAMATVNPEVGTMEYMAPELFTVNNDIVTHKADVYSFGVLLWAMLPGKHPWPELQMVAIAVKVNMLGERPPVTAIPADRRRPKLERLLRACWEQDPARRPAAAEVVKQLLLVQEQESTRAQRGS